MKVSGSSTPPRLDAFRTEQAPPASESSEQSPIRSFATAEDSQRQSPAALTDKSSEARIRHLYAGSGKRRAAEMKELRQAAKDNGIDQALEPAAYLMAIAKSGESIDDIPQEDLLRLTEHNQSARETMGKLLFDRGNIQENIAATNFEARARFSIAGEVMEKFGPHIKSLVGQSIAKACGNDSAAASTLKKLDHNIMVAIATELTGAGICDGIIARMLLSHLPKLKDGETMKVYGSRAMMHTWAQSGNMMDDVWAGMPIFNRHSKVRSPAQIRSYPPRTLQFAQFAPELASLDRSHAVPLKKVFDEVGAALENHAEIKPLIAQRLEEFHALTPEQRQDPERWKHLPEAWPAPSVFSDAFREQGIEKADSDPEIVAAVLEKFDIPAPSAEHLQSRIKLGEEILATRAGRAAGKPIIVATEQAPDIAVKAKLL